MESRLDLESCRFFTSLLLKENQMFIFAISKRKKAFAAESQQQAS